MAEPTFEATAAVVPQIVDSGVSAVLAFNDQMALGVLAGLTNLGLSVPDDISVVGFDDVPMAAMVAPAADDHQLADSARSEPWPSPCSARAPSTKELFGELVVRHSTARARERRASAVADRGRPSSAAGPG